MGGLLSKFESVLRWWWWLAVRCVKCDIAHFLYRPYQAHGPLSAHLTHVGFSPTFLHSLSTQTLISSLSSLALLISLTVLLQET
ncbi:hypothetical protein MRB53_007698 [Persea americana]|uniref:Uncharacterized protein n=1 Tax=Persea americana TaxID=3435 RepID=A0ACC2MKQ2_PERAE|nr:hypothetical protein MRB53_007698 [Persea americana]